MCRLLAILKSFVVIFSLINVGGANKTLEAISEICKKSKVFDQSCNLCYCGDDGKITCALREEGCVDIDKCTASKKYADENRHQCTCLEGEFPLCYDPEQFLPRNFKNTDFENAAGRNFLGKQEGEYFSDRSMDEYTKRMQIKRKQTTRFQEDKIRGSTGFEYDYNTAVSSTTGFEYDYSNTAVSTLNLEDYNDNNRDFEALNLEDYNDNNRDFEEEKLIKTICSETSTFTIQCNNCTCVGDAIECTSAKCEKETALCPLSRKLETDIKCKTCYCIKNEIPWCYYPESCPEPMKRGQGITFKNERSLGRSNMQGKMQDSGSGDSTNEITDANIIEEICKETQAFSQHCNNCTCTSDTTIECTEEECDPIVPECPESGRFEASLKCGTCFCVKGNIPWCHFPDSCPDTSLDPTNICAQPLIFYQGCKVCQCVDNINYACKYLPLCGDPDICTANIRFENQFRHKCICVDGELPICLPDIPMSRIPGGGSASPVNQGASSRAEKVITGASSRAAKEITEANIEKEICSETQTFKEDCNNCTCTSGTATCTKEICKATVSKCQNSGRFETKYNCRVCFCVEDKIPWCYYPKSCADPRRVNPVIPPQRYIEQSALEKIYVGGRMQDASKESSTKITESNIMSEICKEALEFTEHCNNCTCQSPTTADCTKEECTPAVPLCPYSGRVETKDGCRVCFCIKDKIPWCFYPDTCEVLEPQDTAIGRKFGKGIDSGSSPGRDLMEVPKEAIFF